jgi:hypothetical protein
MVSVFDEYILATFGIVVCMCIWKLIALVNSLRLDLIHYVKLFILIMIDVKLTPVVLTAYLFV